MWSVVLFSVFSTPGNQHLYMPTPLFNGVHNLVELYLGDTTLGNLDLQLFAGLDNLMSLDLSHNELKVIPTGVADPNFLKSLQNLDLSYNELSYLGNDTMPLLKRVPRVSGSSDQLAFQRSFALLQLSAAEFILCCHCFVVLCGVYCELSVYLLFQCLLCFMGP